jgi:hypothetical protein
MDKDGNVKTLPLFGDINVRTPKYTFSHPTGLLFATQFAQIALVVTEKAAFEDMRYNGLVQNDCAFAGHSLGEYSALASIADVLPISSLVDVVTSSRLDKVLKKWDQDNWASPEQRQKLYYPRRASCLPICISRALDRNTGLSFQGFHIREVYTKR